MKLLKRLFQTQYELHHAETPIRAYALQRQFDKLDNRYYKATQRMFNPVHLVEGWGR